jgi:hypothetical protein
MALQILKNVSHEIKQFAATSTTSQLRAKLRHAIDHDPK